MAELTSDEGLGHQFDFDHFPAQDLLPSTSATSAFCLASQTSAHARLLLRVHRSSEEPRDRPRSIRSGHGGRPLYLDHLLADLHGAFGDCCWMTVVGA